MKTLKLFLAATVSIFIITGCADGTDFPADNNLVLGGAEDQDITLDPNGRVDLMLDLYTLTAAFPVNAQIKYIVELRNPGPDEAPQAVVTVSLPGGTTIDTVSPPSGWTCNVQDLGVTCFDESELFSGLATFEIDVTGPSVTGNITAFTVASSTLIDLNTDDNAKDIETAIGVSTADLQTQIDAAAPGATILVGPGVYVGCLDFGGKDVKLQSTGGAEVTTINAYDCGAAVTIGPDGSLEGFTVTDFSSSGLVGNGPGVDVTGTGTLIADNIFETNNPRIAASGKAIDGNNASPVIERNIFRNISCDTQFTSGTVGFVNSSSPMIRNNVFENNRCRGTNMVLPVANVPKVINNTFVDNDTGIYFTRDLAQGTQVYRNNILVGNGIGIDADGGTDANNPVFENNLVFGNIANYDEVSDQTGSNGNISSDPLFVDAAAGDYQLQAGSPAIDTGNAVDAPANDYDGNARPLNGDGLGGAEFDMGAFEAPTI